MRALFVVLCASMILTTVPVDAGDNWQAVGRPSICANSTGPRLDRCQEWVRTAERPDYPGASCCGEGDLFISDNFKLGPNGELIAEITADYPEPPIYQLDDGTIMPPGFYVKRGMEIIIPKEKVITALKDANRSGHGGVYLRPSDGEVLCYAFPPLT